MTCRPTPHGLARKGTPAVGHVPGAPGEVQPAGASGEVGVGAIGVGCAASWWVPLRLVSFQILTGLLLVPMLKSLRMPGPATPLGAPLLSRSVTMLC